MLVAVQEFVAAEVSLAVECSLLSGVLVTVEMFGELLAVEIC